MAGKDVFSDLQRYVIEMKKEEVLKTVKTIINQRLDLRRALETMSSGMQTVGDKYSKKEYFIPEVLLAADAMEAGVGLIEPHLKKEIRNTQETVVMGTVLGDIHSLGKNLVKIMLKTAGFTVQDLGVNVDPKKFVATIKETNARILCMSSLMTTTRDSMKQTLDALKQAKIRDKVKVVIGGGAISALFANQIAADAYGKDAMEAVKIIKKLCKR